MIQSVDVRRGVAVADVAVETSAEELDEICRRSAAACAHLERLGRQGRARLLAAMADALEAGRPQLVGIADQETALGPARLGSELTRTCFQLRFFADVLLDGAYLEVSIDHAGETPMGRQPDLRRMLRPLGSVAVFGASNFPFAFSVPGGDTASALAAGCPVVVKAHDAHPATSVLCARSLSEAAERLGLPGHVVNLVFGQESSVGLVSHPLIKAVGFTGSLAGGRYLHGVAARRPSPVPFYGELGAVNALVVAPGAAQNRAAEIAQGLAASFTLGVGQFCTKPGLVFVPSGPDGDRLVEALGSAVSGLTGATMLSNHIAEVFTRATVALKSLPGVTTRAEGRSSEDGAAAVTPLLLEVEAASLRGPVLEECFGPVAVVTRYSGAAHLLSLMEALSPALTATVHADPVDDSFVVPVIEFLSDRAGRVVWNGFPTGVAVAWAMHHGGPYPATTDPLHTSVGAAAIRRWLRPVAFQDVPQHLLPPEVRDAPTHRDGVPRRVDGCLVLP